MVVVRFSAGEEYLSFFYSIQTSCGTYPASYPMGNGVLSPEVKWPVGMKLTSHFNLVQRSSIVEVYLHSPIHFHGMLLN
jgi:hypothetical protein